MSAVLAAPSPSAQGRLRQFLSSGGVVWTLVFALAIATAVTTEDFRTAANLSNVARQAVVLSLVALGQFLVVLTGGVDLSLGMIVRMGALSSAITIGGFDERLVLGIGIALFLGLCAGVVNGVVVTRLRVPAFIATFGSLAVLQGLSLSMASVPRGRTSPLLTRFWNWEIGPMYGVVVVTGVVWIAFWLLLARTVWGQHLYATGGAPKIAEASGVRTRLAMFSAFVVAGLLAAGAGVLTAARAGVGDPNAGFGLEFESLAAVVIGGASLAGGRGRLLGALGGVALLSLIGNVFNLVGVEVWYQQLLKGLIILIGAAAYVGRPSERRA
jgi:ribose transport system permease protein